MQTDNLWEVILNSVLTFFVLLVLTRVLGKKQLSQLTFFNYVTGITIGSIAANMIDMKWEQFTVTIWGLVTWSVLTVIVSILILKIPKAGTLLHGQPSIVIKDGKIQYKALRYLGIDMDNLMMLLREKDVFLIRDVKYAILETNGELSVLKDPNNEYVTKKDLEIKVDKLQYLPMDLVIDGKAVKKNLKEVNLSMNWLYKELKKHGITDLKEVLYAQLQSDGTVYVDKKEKKKKKTKSK